MAKKRSTWLPYCWSNLSDPPAVCKARGPRRSDFNMVPLRPMDTSAFTSRISRGHFQTGTCFWLESCCAWIEAGLSNTQGSQASAFTLSGSWIWANSRWHAAHPSELPTPRIRRRVWREASDPILLPSCWSSQSLATTTVWLTRLVRPMELPFLSRNFDSKPAACSQHGFASCWVFAWTPALMVSCAVAGVAHRLISASDLGRGNISCSGTLEGWRFVPRYGSSNPLKCSLPWPVQPPTSVSDFLSWSLATPPMHSLAWIKLLLPPAGDTEADLELGIATAGSTMCARVLAGWWRSTRPMAWMMLL